MPETEDLAAVIREIRERVRARHPQPGNGSGHVPDLMPLVHARDAAEGKVAAIGTVNPRAGGLINSAIQTVKRLVARALDWHVREQVEFNRNMVASLNAIIETLNENNRVLAQVQQQMNDAATHWSERQAEWDKKLTQSEVTLLRSISDLQAAYQHRLTLAEGSFRESLKFQHSEFATELERAAEGQEQAAQRMERHFWGEFEKARAEYERLLYNEVSVMRQRASAGTVTAPTPIPHLPSPDWLWFAERFRGSEASVAERQRFYVPHFGGHRRVLDVGCGRGEFLELMREAGIEARGIDLSAECVALCRSKGLNAEQADLFQYLEPLPEGSLDGIYSGQVVEHLPPQRLPDFVRLAATRLDRGGLLVIETPNPECLAIFATHFYLDPTHTRPVPYQLLAFYMREYGLGLIKVERLSPAVETFPALASLPPDFRDAFFGGLDYAIFGRRLS